MRDQRRMNDDAAAAPSPMNPPISPRRPSAMAHSRPLFVLFGASMTEYSFSPGGWGASLVDLYSRKADVVLRGYRGWNTRRAVSVLHEFFPKEQPIQPALVVVFFGANDAAFPVPSGKGQHVPLQEFKDNLKRISLYLKGLSDTTRVILVTAPPINEEGRRKFARDIYGENAGNFLDRTNERAKMYSRACIQASEEANVGVVDLWTAVQKISNWQTSCLSDGMHLTPKGNAVLFNELVHVLETADWLPSLHWKSMTEDYAEPSNYDSVHPSFEYSDESYLES